MESDPREMSKRATELLATKKIRRVAVQSATQVMVECQDGARLYITASEAGLELSITGADAG